MDMSKHQGWVTANQTGITFTDWIKDKELVDENVLVADAKNPNPKSVKMTIILLLFFACIQHI